MLNKKGKIISKEVRIENTSLCNTRCAICPRERMTRAKLTMPNEHFCWLVDQAKELGAEVITIFGYGEPLMDKEIFRKIEYCAEQELETFISTNVEYHGIIPSAQLLWAGLNHIRFSVPEVWEERAVQNISSFVKMRESRNPNCKTTVSVVSAGRNKLENIRAFWEPMVDYLEVWKPHNWAGGRSYRTINPQKVTCGRPFKGPVQIQADGKVIVCCFDFDGKMVIGDTHKERLETILKGLKLCTIQKKHKKGNLGGLLCTQCDQLNVGDNPLIYSNRDPQCRDSRSSTTKLSML